MIRNATKDMLPQLIELWGECFGDSEEYSSFFFQNKMIGTDVFQNQYVYMTDEHIVSMLSVLPAVIIEEKEERLFWYVYGVATKKEYRKKGYAGRLLNHILAKAMEEDAAVGLVPANDALFGYYKKFGFETYFYHKILQFDRKNRYEKRNMCIEPISYEHYVQLRKESYQSEGVVVWDEKSVAYALKENENLHGSACEVRYEGKSYFSLFCKSNEELLVRETNVPEFLLQSIFCSLAEKEKCSKVRIIYSPSESNETGKEKHGMIYNKKNNLKYGYLGLALD